MFYLLAAKEWEYEHTFTNVPSIPNISPAKYYKLTLFTQFQEAEI